MELKIEKISNGFVVHSPLGRKSYVSGIAELLELVKGWATDSYYVDPATSPSIIKELEELDKALAGKVIMTTMRKKRS